MIVNPGRLLRAVAAGSILVYICLLIDNCSTGNASTLR